jgi:ribosomal protein L34E
MTKRGAILDRMQRHQEALQKAHEYLARGGHGHWHGFRPLFDARHNRLPRPEWIVNVFLRRRRGALKQCENALETLNGKAKERRVSERRKRISESGPGYFCPRSVADRIRPCEGRGSGSTPDEDT